MTALLSNGLLRASALLSALFLTLMFAGLALTPDAVRRQNAPDQFDARAARERLVRILGDETPHPVDSAAQDVVRETLLREITALGLTPEIRDTFACRPQPRGPLVDCARVRNIIFSIGPSSGPAILAAAHYDSVPAAPGASDDGIGLSVWLEVARALKDESLQRRVIFLFSDGEEPGLLGAYAFANDDPLMASVESLVNLEARGTRGPAVFFESNQPNADAIAAFAAAPRPIANSVMADVYALLSNSSDVTALTRPGLDVINVALIDGLEDYHTPHDTVASQDLRSVQHMGDTALAVTRRLASRSDADVAAPMVYTDIASRVFVYAPSWAGQAALALSFVVALIMFWRAGAQGRWRALAAPIAGLLIAGALAFAAGFLLSMVRPGEAYAFAHPEPTRAWCILCALCGATAAVWIAGGGRNPRLAAAVSMLWLTLIGGVASIFIGGISMLYAIPALIYAAGSLVALAWRPAEWIGIWFAALVMLFVWAPLIYLVELALGFDMPVVFAILSALVLLSWSAPLGAASGDKGGWRAPAALGAAAIACVVLSAVTPDVSAERSRSLNISYFRDYTGDRARVIAGTSQRALPPELAEAFEPEAILPGDLFDTWARPAATEEITPPALHDIVTSGANGERIVRARLVMNGAYRVMLRIPLDARPLRARVNGVETDFADTGGERRDYMNLACQGRACDGAIVEIVLEPSESDADWYVIGQFPGRGSAAAETYRSRRPPSATPIQFGDSTITLSRFGQ
jgi:Peptidase family M28